MDLIAHNLAPIMFGGLIVFLLFGFPVAFSLGACGLFFGFVGVQMGALPEALLQALPLRLFGIMHLPMPRVPPVTTTVLPATSKSSDGEVGALGSLMWCDGSPADPGAPDHRPLSWPG